MKALIFDTKEQCSSWIDSVSDRIEHDPDWIYDTPHEMADGRFLSFVTDSIVPSLTSSEVSAIVEVQAEDLKPEPGPPHAP